MRSFGRIFFLTIILKSFSIDCSSQLIEKAPPSPVTITAAPVDSINALLEVSEIILSGFKRTKPYIIEREIPFKKGDSIQSSELLAKLTLCKQQIMNTSLFVDVDVKSIKLDSSRVYIDIHVKERWYLFPLPYFRIVGRNFNDWWVQYNHRLSRVDYGLKFMQNNFSGRNDNLNIWVIAGYTQQLSLRYDNPYIDKKLKHGINIGFSYRRNRELNYAVNNNKQSFLKREDEFLIRQFHTDFSYTYRPAIKTRHIFRTAYTDMRVSDTVVTLNPRFLPGAASYAKFGELSYTLQYNNVDYLPYPLKGFTGEASIYKRFGKNINIWQLSGRGNYHLKISPKTFAQFQGVASIRLPFNQPYISNSFMGSSDFYMRGLEYYVIEGVAGGVGRATLKNEIISVNVINPIKSKTHNKIPLRVFLKGFSDVGYAYSKNFGNSVLNNKLLRTWGFGVDIVTFYDVVVRLEYSFNHLGDRGLFFHTQTDF